MQACLPEEVNLLVGRPAGGRDLPVAGKTPPSSPNTSMMASWRDDAAWPDGDGSALAPGKTSSKASCSSASSTAPSTSMPPPSLSLSPSSSLLPPGGDGGGEGG